MTFQRLVNLGDQVFGLVVTDLIRETFPYLCVGPSSVRPIGISLVRP
jgi:dsRNA-specific ribonuclease